MSDPEFNFIPERESADLSLKTNRNLYQYKVLLRLSDRELENQTILDLGSGSKLYFAQQVEESIPGAKVVSLDADLTREEGGDLKTEKGLFTKLPFPDQSFSMVVSVGAMPLYLHNREQIREAFLEVVRVLKKGGRGIFEPVTYTDIVNTDPKKEVHETHEQHTYEEAKEMIEGILKTMPDIKFEFLPDIYYEPRHPVPGRSKHEPSVLNIYKL